MAEQQGARLSYKASRTLENPGLLMSALRLHYRLNETRDRIFILSVNTNS